MKKNVKHDLPTFMTFNKIYNKIHKNNNKFNNIRNEIQNLKTKGKMRNLQNFKILI